ncbi:riboflavin synthase [Citrifermentans bemidjiense Bem]|uniref:Riboflavin synthase n=1 Tax=Citrifermentans bemidjiense (strain ATCC BAA-1014 / DSM 16622 / JCM 12645 / Bem) TaxID=404380 RepID=B5E856_CITBB|nr:riboflavin synthase [Citrifermentans bemidjiense]ACH40025.1 riboflavin synthase [Citrifermentans bemidjiense Bem]
MFTGLIETVGELVSIEKRGASGSLTVKTSLPLDEVAIGASIAINGACLTVVRKGGGAVTFDISPETIDRTGFKNLKSGSPVNMERAMRLSDRLDGHLVSGHVDCVATVIERREVAGNIVFSFRFPPQYGKYIAAKGSVAIDGISLTVNSAGPDSFSINVIPHTAAKTTLIGKRVGDEVNIETDLLCRYLERLLAGRETGGEGVTLDLLAKTGFL